MRKKEILAILLLLLIAFFATGCKTIEYVPVELKTTEYQDRHVRDSVFFRDTTHIHTIGDTVFVDVVRWRERWHSDTVRIEKTDSIPVIVKVPVEVNKLTWWQSVRLKALNYVIAALALLLGWRQVNKWWRHK